MFHSPDETKDQEQIQKEFIYNYIFAVFTNMYLDLELLEE